MRHPYPHTHQQHGRVERKHRHIADLGLTLLTKASMPLTYWWEAFTSAVYLINPLPTTVLHSKSPFELLFHQQPNYLFLKKSLGVAATHTFAHTTDTSSNFVLPCVYVWDIAPSTRVISVFTHLDVCILLVLWPLMNRNFPMPIYSPLLLCLLQPHPLLLKHFTHFHLTFLPYLPFLLLSRSLPALSLTLLP